MQRRILIKGTLPLGAIALAASNGLFYPVRALAGNILFQSSGWNSKAFTANNLQTAIKSALGSDLTEASDNIAIDAPNIAENGAIIPITVSSTLKNVSTISLFAEKNSTPLVALFELNPDVQAFVSTRIKMSKTSDVIAIITAEGKNYSNRKEIKVTIGGCGN